eukprot:14876765-Ditylum_brightwellii.AAC.1
MDKYDCLQSHTQHIQPTHHITEQQRLRQVWFVKDSKRPAKKRGLTSKEIKDFNVFIKDKIKETIKEYNRNMHVMSSIEDFSISSSNKSIQ